MPKSKPTKLARWVSTEDLVPFKDRKKEELQQIGSQDGYTTDDYWNLDKKYGYILSDFLQENGDARHHLNSPFKGVDNSIAYKTHGTYNYQGETAPSISTVFENNDNSTLHIQMTPVYYSQNRADSYRIKSEHKYPLIFINTSHRPSNEKSLTMIDQKHLKPEEAHDFVDDIPDGPEKEELKSYLNKHFPRSEASPEKMRRKAVKFSRYVSNDEINHFMSRFEQDANSILSDAGDEDKSKEISDLRKQYYQIMADYFEDHGDPRSALLRGDEPHVSSKRDMTINDSFTKLGHKHIGTDPDSLAHDSTLTMVAYKPKLGIRGMPFVQVKSKIVKDAGTHAVRVDPESAYGMAKSLPDDNHRAEAMGFLEQYFPHLKEKQPEKMNKPTDWRIRFRKAIAHYSGKRKAIN